MDYEEFVAARRTRLVRSAALLGCRPSDAEDVVQTALIKCLRHWDKVQRADDSDAYTYRILINAVRDWQSRPAGRELPAPELPEGSTDPDLVTGLAVRAALLDLVPAQREVLILRYYADLSERETAEVLDVALGTVKSRAARAIRALSEAPDLRGDRDVRRG